MSYKKYPGKAFSALLFGLITVVALFILPGCRTTSVLTDPSIGNINPMTEHQEAGFRSVSCDAIWLEQHDDTLVDPLFWLRAIDCANQLPRKIARDLAKQQTDDNWQNSFKKSILLSVTEPTIATRQNIINNTSKYSVALPDAVKVLFDLWREQQISLLNVQEERKRYRQLVTSTDNKIDTLKAQESKLQHQLKETSKKLARLTNIEHELSTRKQLQQASPPVPRLNEDTNPSGKPTPPTKSPPPSAKPSSPTVSQPTEPVISAQRQPESQQQLALEEPSLTELNDEAQHPPVAPAEKTLAKPIIP